MIENTTYYWNLITRAQNGHKNSFIELANFYKKMVYLHALKLNGSIAVAEAVTNDVFLKAWQHIKYLNENSPFNLWLNGLTISVSASYYQGKGKKCISSKKQKELILANDFDKKFIKLSPRQRILLILHDLEGYSVSDILVMLNEKKLTSLSKDLDNARNLFLDKNAVNLIKSYSEKEWRKLTQDFEYWLTHIKSEKNLTPALKLLNNYRLLLNDFLAKNLPSDCLLDDLKIKINEECKSHKGNNNPNVKEKVKTKIKESNKDQFKLTYDAAEIFSNTDDVKEQFSKKLNTVKRRKRILKNFSFLLVLTNLIIIIFVVGNIYQNVSWGAKSNSKFSVKNNEETNLTINAGDVISTIDDEFIYIEVPSVGTITLLPNSNIKVLNTETDNNQIEVLNGQIKLNTNTFYNRFSVLVDNISIEDFGSSSTITFLPESSQKNIIVDKGELNITSNNKIIPIPENYLYNIGNIASFYNKSSSKYINSVCNLKLPISSSNELKKILSRSIKEDGITLWAMMNNADKSARELIFTRLTKYFEIPKSVTKNGILNHNNEMMKLLLEEIEWQL